MAKLKLGAIEDDKPVKDDDRAAGGAASRSRRLRPSPRARDGARSSRARETHCAHAGAVHGDGPRIREDAALRSTADGRQGVALPQNLEETRQGGVFVVRSPMGGIGEPSSLRDEAFEGSTADRAKSLKDVFERCCREGGLGVSTST